MKRTIFIILLVFIMTIGFASASDTNTTNDLSLDDSQEIISTEHSIEGDSFKDIQDAVNAACDDDTIYLNGKTYIGNGTQITVNKSITIDGSTPGGNSKAIIDANDSSRVFNANGKYSIVIKNIIFQKLKFVESGTAIYQNSGNLSVMNCEARDSNCTTGHLEGGLIYIGANSNLYVDTFESYNLSINTPNSVDGFILAIGKRSKLIASNLKNHDNTVISTTTRYVSRGGYGFIDQYSEASISNFESYNNNYSYPTKDSFGTSFYLDRYGKINMTNVIFADNKIRSLGKCSGHVLFTLQDCNAFLTNCTSRNNEVYSKDYIFGGLVYIANRCKGTLNKFSSENDTFSCDTYISGAIFATSTYSNFTIANIVVLNDNVSTSSYNYGFLYTNGDGEAHFENMTFIGNKLISKENSVYGLITSNTECNMTIASARICNNEFDAKLNANGNGFFISSQCNADIRDVNFSYNKISADKFYGGFIRFQGVNLNLSNITICRNNLTSDTFSYGFIYTYASCRYDFSNMNIVENEICNSINESPDPYDITMEYGMMVIRGIGKISKSNISSNIITSGLGVAMQITPYSHDVPTIIEHCAFENNKVRVASKDHEDMHFVNHGGAICISGYNNGTAIIRNCLFVNNANSQGGAITPHNNCLIESCKFINNTATKFYGGAISTEDGFYRNDANITVKDCYFENNAAPIGGAIQAKGDYVNITNCTFKDNSAVQGGAVFLEGNNLTLVDCTFIDNNATRSIDSRVVIDVDFLPQVKDWNAFGGAVYIHGYNSYLYNNTFKYNSAIHPDSDYDDMGGAVYIYGDNATIIKGYFDDNFAHSGNGSAIYIMGVNATVDLSEFYNHDAGRGTIFIQGSYAEILNSIFKNNTASRGGAGIYSIGNYSLVDNCQFEDNNATIHGGAIHTHGDYIRILNSKFISNNAHPSDEDMDNGLGGAIYIKGDYNDIAYCGFDFNTARNGSAIYNRGENLTIEDCDFHYNQAYSYNLLITVKPVVSKYTKNNRIEINITHIGGDNIINAIYNDGSYKNIYFYNVTYEHSSTAGGKRNSGLTRVNPVESAEASNNGELIYQDSREDLQIINVTVAREEYMGLLGASEISGDVIQEFSGRTGLYGNISFDLTGDLKPGTYNVYASHPDDWLYKGIENTTRFEITPQVDLSISKSSDCDSYFVGDTATYTITLNSLGTDAHDVDVREILPEGFEIIEYNASKGEFGDNVWYIELLEEGSSATLTVKVKLTNNGTFTNTVNVTSRENDTNQTNNVANKTITVKNYVDLDVTKTSSVESVNVGDTIVWTITVKNNGIVNATGVKATDKLPSGVRYISHLAGKGVYDPETGVWNISDLAVNETVTLNITVEALTAGRITNTVTVSSNEDDNSTENNEASTTVEVSDENPDDEIPTDDPEKDEPEIDDGVNPKDNDESISSSISNGHATGNPILLVLLALLSICITAKRKL